MLTLKDIMVGMAGSLFLGSSQSNGRDKSVNKMNRIIIVVMKVVIET